MRKPGTFVRFFTPCCRGFGSRKRTARKRTAGSTQLARVLIYEPLEAWALLSVAPPVGLQAVPALSSDYITTPGNTGFPAPYTAANYPGAPGASGLTPNQIRGAYGLGSYTSGVLSNGITFGGIQGDGRGQTIAIVDAYDDPNAASDLNAFSSYYGIPTFGGPESPTFSKLNESGGATLPGTDPIGPYVTTAKSDWEQEESLDIEWAHATAPLANIILFEASGPDLNDLLTAVHTAAGWPGVVTVSMSWEMSQFGGETADDSYFVTPPGQLGVTFLAAAGDNGAYPANQTTLPPITPQYPASSPNVVAVGGTTLAVNGSSPNYTYGGEIAWGNGANSWKTVANGGGGGGGGISTYENQPSYQNGAASASITTTDRAYPERLRRRQPLHRCACLRFLGLQRSARQSDPLVTGADRWNQPCHAVVGGHGHDRRRRPSDRWPGIAERSQPDSTAALPNAARCDP